MHAVKIVQIRYDALFCTALKYRREPGLSRTDQKLKNNNKEIKHKCLTKTQTRHKEGCTPPGGGATALGGLLPVTYILESSCPADVKL